MVQIAHVLIQIILLHGFEVCISIVITIALKVNIREITPFNNKNEKGIPN